MTPTSRFRLLALGASLLIPTTCGPALAQSPAQAQAGPATTTPPVAQAAAPKVAPTTPRNTASAATIPNTFDGPAAPREGTPRQAAPPAGPAKADPAVVAAAETGLKATIAALQAGTPNYADMSPALAEKVRPLAANFTPLIESFGALKTVAYIGQEDRAQLFLVIFDRQATQWIIAQGEDGKIVALLFRPAPSADETAVPAPAPAAIPAQAPATPET